MWSLSEQESAGLFAALNLPRDFENYDDYQSGSGEQRFIFGTGRNLRFCAMKVIMTVILKIRCVRGDYENRKESVVL